MSNILISSEIFIPQSARILRAFDSRDKFLEWVQYNSKTKHISFIGDRHVLIAKLIADHNFTSVKAINLINRISEQMVATEYADLRWFTIYSL